MSAPAARPVDGPGAWPDVPAPGSWRLHRRVVDRAAGGRGVVRGVLEVSAEGAGQRWVERGLLSWGGEDREVTRTSLLLRGADGWWVHFGDGRPFHPWRPGTEVEHQCAADLYRGRVDLAGDRMRTRWAVGGPAKDQLLLTRLRRLGP